MADYLFNYYGERNVYNPSVVTAAPPCRWPPAQHLEASVKQIQPVKLCEMLQHLKSEHGVACSALAVGDKLMIDLLPSDSRLHSVGVKINVPIAGFGFAIERLSGATITADATTTVLTDSNGVCTGNVTLAQPTGLGATQRRSTYWISRATGNVALPDVLVLTITALPVGGICPVGTGCCGEAGVPDISFTVNIDNGQHLG